MSRLYNRKHRNVPDDAVFIGRPSKWGNPYTLGRDGDRDTVILKYVAYLKTRPDLIADLDELAGCDLVCFCTPLMCHGDVLLALANATPEERLAFLEEG